ncbi:MAG TPA: amidohydrolase family protein, partial [Acidimicrobiales bacterium]|nr:amidohydrolase family protein [Acidimicrobiales bacterium]
MVVPGVADRGLLVRGAGLPDWSLAAPGCIPPGPRVEVRLAGGRIVAVGGAGTLQVRRHDEVLEVPGGVLLPGLHDHHLHVRALVAARRSARAGPDDVAGVEELARALGAAPVDRHGWRRAVGYHESVAGPLDRRALDALAPGGPLRLQHRSGVLWVLNSAAVTALGLDEVDEAGIERDGRGTPTGRLVRMDGWLARRLPHDDPVADVGPVSAALAAAGVTGVTDATAGATTPGVAALAGAVETGALRQRLHVLCPPGVDPPPHPLVSRGPVKIVLDDDRLPGLDDLAAEMDRAHGAGVAVAVHCVTAPQVVLTAAALGAVGSVAGDRIEHGSVVPAGLMATLASLGVTVVTNPGLVLARGDRYLADVDPAERPDLYRAASLEAAGVGLAAGTDAPFGPADPWSAIGAAHARRTRAGRSLGPDEALSLRRA